MVFKSFLFIGLLCSFGSTAKYSVSLKDLDHNECMQYTTKGSYDFYSREEMLKIEDLQSGGKRDNDIVNLNIFVVGDGSLSIVLTSVEQMGAYKSAYEILFRNENQMETEILISNIVTEETVASKRVAGILPATDPLPLNIRVSRHSEITVTVIGPKEISLTAAIANLSPPEYIRFSTSFNSKAIWYFNCKSDIHSDLDRSENSIPAYKSNMDSNNLDSKDKTIPTDDKNKDGTIILFLIFVLFLMAVCR